MRKRRPAKGRLSKSVPLPVKQMEIAPCCIIPTPTDAKTFSTAGRSARFAESRSTERPTINDLRPTELPERISASFRAVFGFWLPQCRRRHSEPKFINKIKAKNRPKTGSSMAHSRRPGRPRNQPPDPARPGDRGTAETDVRRLFRGRRSERDHQARYPADQHRRRIPIPNAPAIDFKNPDQD